MAAGIWGVATCSLIVLDGRARGAVGVGRGGGKGGGGGGDLKIAHLCMCK